MIKAIIFDFYGVIHSDDYHDWLARHGLKRGGQFKSIISGVDKGQASVDQFFINLSGLSGIPTEQIRNEFSANSSLNEPLLTFILELKKTYKIGLLSNANSSHLKEVLKSTGADKLFDSIVISSDLGITKPSSEMYESILDKMALKPEEALLIDDNPRFIEAAINLGLKGLVYTDFTSLISQLKTIGIIE